MTELTLDMLKAMAPHEIIATGMIADGPYPGLHMTNTEQMLRWVAVRGGYWDWAIYVHTADMPIGYVMESGDKLRNREKARWLVPCDEAAFNMYRD